MMRQIPCDGIVHGMGDEGGRRGDRAEDGSVAGTVCHELDPMMWDNDAPLPPSFCHSRPVLQSDWPAGVIICLRLIDGLTT